MLTAVVSLTILGGLFGLGLGWAARRFRVESDPVVDRIDAILPQTQCGQCNYPGCRPYAEAIAAGEAPINQCPPGGEDGIRALADLLGVGSAPWEAFGSLDAEIRVFATPAAPGSRPPGSACRPVVRPARRNGRRRIPCPEHPIDP